MHTIHKVTSDNDDIIIYYKDPFIIVYERWNHPYKTFGIKTADFKEQIIFMNCYY